MMEKVLEETKIEVVDAVVEEVLLTHKPDTKLQRIVINLLK